MPLAEMGSDPWAFGPICNIIEDVVELQTPVEHTGALGMWTINEAQRANVQEQALNTAFG